MSRNAIRVLVASFTVLTGSGCDQLFPELTGTTVNDLATATDGGTTATTISGAICVLSDLRNPALCTGVGAGLRVTIEETRMSTDVDGTGHFTLAVPATLTQATLAVVDGPATTGSSTPTISLLSQSVLTAARLNGVILPSVRAAQMSSLQLESGSYDDPTRGAILGWLLDASGRPVANVAATPISGGFGPLYDAPSSGGLGSGATTGTYGALAFLNLAPGNAMLTVTTPSTSPLAGDTFTIPIRGGAVTTTALSLPAR